MAVDNLDLGAPVVASTESYERYAIDGNVPFAVADFVANRYAMPDGAGGWEVCAFDDLFTFTGPSGREYTDADGVTQTAASNVPRIAHHQLIDGVLTNTGLLIDSAVEALTIAGTDFPVDVSNQFSLHLAGLFSYTDNSSSNEVVFYNWGAGGVDRIYARIRTNNLLEGEFQVLQFEGSNVSISSAEGVFAPGGDMPFSIVTQHGDSEVGAASDGVLIGADTSPVAAPDLSGSAFEVAETFTGSLGRLLIYPGALSDANAQALSYLETPAAEGLNLFSNTYHWDGAKGNVPPTGAVKAGNLTQYARDGGGLFIDRNGEGGTNTEWPATIEVGKDYRFRVRITDVGVGDVRVVLYEDGTAFQTFAAEGVGIVEHSFTATDTDFKVGMRSTTSAAGATFTIDDMELREQLT